MLDLHGNIISRCRAPTGAHTHTQTHAIVALIS